MSKLYLRPVGGFGARMIPLLQVMSAIEREFSHSLVVCWPLHTTSSGGRAGSTRERVFPLSINDLYALDPPLTTTRETVHGAKAREFTHYSLKHTQNLDGKGKSPVHLSHHVNESFCIDAHGYFSLDPDRPNALVTDAKEMGLLYSEKFKLHPRQQDLYESLKQRMEGRPTVGVYLRQSKGANYQVRGWNATGSILPKMRHHYAKDSSTLFFVVSDEKPILDRIVEEFSADNVLMTPKPNIVNHPDEMLGVVVDIELMRHVDIYYPTWGSWLGKLMGLVREGDGCENPLAWGFGRETIGQRLKD